MDPICSSSSTRASADSPARLPGHLPSGHWVPLVRQEMCHGPLPGFPSLPARPDSGTSHGAVLGAGGVCEGPAGLLRGAQGRLMVSPLLKSQFPFLLWVSWGGISPGLPSTSRNSGEGPCPCQGWECLDDSWPGGAGTGSAWRSARSWAGRPRSCASPAKDGPSSVAEGSRR